MPPYSCPHCGSRVTAGIDRLAVYACPNCCARLEPLNGSLWREQEPQPRFARRSIRMRLACESGAPATARRALTEFATALDEDVAIVAELLASELVTNSVQHASGNGDAVIELSARLLPPRQIHVAVWDDGPGFQRPGRRRGYDVRTGWGLTLVDQLADAWGVEAAAGTKVWFELAAPVEAPSARRDAR